MSLTKVTYSMIDGAPVNVKDFGAVGDGVTDDTAAIQAAIDYAEAQTLTFVRAGIEIYLPGGAYLISSVLTVTIGYVGIRGAGRHITAIIRTDGNGDILVIGSVEATISSNSVRDLSLEHRGNATSGVALRLVRCLFGFFDNLDILGWSTGIESAATAVCNFSNITFTQAGRSSGRGFHAFRIFGIAATGTHTSDIHLTNIQTRDGSTESLGYSNAFLVNGVDGLYLTNSHMYQCDQILNVFPEGTPGSTIISSIFVSNTYFDSTYSSGQNHVRLQGTATAYRNIQFSNCEFRDARSVSVFGIAAVSQVTFTGCIFRQNRESGIRTESDVEGWVVSGCLFQDNNKNGIATEGDLYIRGQRWNITGCTFIGGNAAGYGLRVLSANSLVTGANFEGSTAGVQLANTGSNNKIVNVLGSGAVIKSRGLATVEIGATTTVVEHDLIATPSITGISITPNSNPTFRGVGAWWVSDVTATTFTINTDAAVIAAGLVFSWQASFYNA